jgi:hypothetical protein
MTVQIHYCPSRGTAQSGDELDCPKCRAELLKAFRSPADVSEIPPAPRGWFAPSRLPHPVEHASPPRFEPDEFETSPAKHTDSGPVPGAHVTRVMTAPYARNIPGGNWYAGCTCGWTATGIWTGGKTEEWAAGQAAAAAEAHKEGLQDQ